MNTGRIPPLPPQQAVASSDHGQPEHDDGHITLFTPESSQLTAGNEPCTAGSLEDRNVNELTAASSYINQPRIAFDQSALPVQGEEPRFSKAADAFQVILQHYRNGEMDSSQIDTASFEGMSHVEILSAEAFEQKLLNADPFSSDVCYVVDGTVDLTRNTRPVSLPDNLVVSGELNLENNPGLKALPVNLFVLEDCTISECLNLKMMGERLIVEGDLESEGCVALTATASELVVYGNTNMARCYNLRGWSGECEGIVDLTGCRRLKKLQHIKAEDLTLSGCYELQELPKNADDFNVWGNINFSGCIRLSSLPDYITSIRGTTKRYITLNDWQSVKALANKDIFESDNIEFSCPPLQDTPERVFNDFSEAFRFWSDKVSSNQAALNHEHLSEDDNGTVIKFLEHLTRTADYRQSGPSVLARRVLDVLPLVSAASDDGTRSQALETMYDAVTTCGDRITRALDDLEGLAQRVKAEQKAMEYDEPAELRQIAKQMVCLSKIKQYALKESIKRELDDVEVELALRIALRDEFSLPGQTIKMESENCFKLSESDKDIFKTWIEKQCTEEVIEEYLHNWEPWQKYQRKKNIRPFEQLDIAYVSSIEECAITVEKSPQMVLLPESGGVHMTYEALVKSYMLSGNHPFTNGPLDWTKVKQLRLTRRLSRTK